MVVENYIFYIIFLRLTYPMFKWQKFVYNLVNSCMQRKVIKQVDGYLII